MEVMSTSASVRLPEVVRLAEFDSVIAPVAPPKTGVSVGASLIGETVMPTSTKFVKVPPVPVLPKSLTTIWMESEPL